MVCIIICNNVGIANKCIFPKIYLKTIWSKMSFPEHQGQYKQTCIFCRMNLKIAQNIRHFILELTGLLKLLDNVLSSLQERLDTTTCLHLV